MTTYIRPEISSKKKYWIDRHRHYELKHFCLQYPVWKQLYLEFSDPSMPLAMIERVPTSNLPGDPTEKRALMRVFYAERMELIERTAKETDLYLYEFLLKAVTEGLSYTYLKARMNIPCSRDTYYDRYRRFFWLLDKSRE
jgi:hypothetical protein